MHVVYIQIHYNEQDVALSKMMRAGNGKQIVWPNVTNTGLLMSLDLKYVCIVGLACETSYMAS